MITMTMMMLLQLTKQHHLPQSVNNKIGYRDGKGSDGGRAKQRKVAAAEANFMQLNTAGCGMLMTERREVINIVQTEHRADVLVNQSSLLALSQVITCNKRELLPSPKGLLSMGSEKQLRMESSSTIDGNFREGKFNGGIST
jgi:hypothetical protein